MPSKSRHSTTRPSGPFMPDMTRLIDISPSAALPTSGKMAPVNGSSSSRPPELNYETSTDLNQITRRQLNEDVSAYRYDLDFCTDQLQNSDLTAHETRTIQLRILDLGHQIRHCQHRMELIDFQTRQPSANGRPMFHFDSAPKRHSTGTAPAPAKKPRLSKVKPSDDNEDTIEVDLQDGSALQRLGYWMCHLCTASKYLSAGTSRVPSAPCKWPLRDISKMLNHYLDMHTEHDPEERCQELGAALDSNRGPFEYWLTRTKTQNLGDGHIIDECVDSLQAGTLPDTLRGLNRAAAAFPNSTSGVKKGDIAD
ncbi:hypothetical protein BJ170DRAFT_93458 [Xylariales sp. AK1849]|nr:hypothetical protein BJ170DRAFT_93458 [Xylariales sp. AK1849]